MMGGGKSRNAPPDSEVRRVSGPWLPTQEPIRDVMQSFLDYYADPQTYENFQQGPSVVAPLNPAQMRGIQGGIDYARGGIPGFNQASAGLARDARMTPRDMPGYNFMTGLASGQYKDPAMDDFRRIAAEAGRGRGAGVGIDALTDFAKGAYVGKNPFLTGMYNAATRDITRNFRESVNPTLEGMISMSGTGGGGSTEDLLRGQAQNELAGKLTDFGQTFYGNAYEQDMGRMLAAAGQLPGAEATRIGTALAGAGGLSNVYNQMLQQRQAGAAGANQAYNQAFQNRTTARSMMPSMFEAGLRPFDIMTGRGGMLQQQAEREAQEARQRFEFERDRMPNFLQQRLQPLAQIGSLGTPGAAAQYSSQVQSQPNFFGQAIGTATGLASAALPFFAPGMPFGVPQPQYNPYGGGSTYPTYGYRGP